MCIRDRGREGVQLVYVVLTDHVSALDVSSIFSRIVRELLNGDGLGRAIHEISPVSYTHLDVYKRQAIDKVAGTVKLVDTDGNNKADTVVYTPAKVGKITYVGSKSVTINNTIGSKDLDDLDIYTGYAKDDFVAVVDKENTSSGNYGVTKLDTTSAKVGSIKSSDPVEVKINDCLLYTSRCV